MSVDDRRQAEFWETIPHYRGFDHPVVRVFARQWARLMWSMIGQNRPRSALDAGCGNGVSTLSLSHMNMLVFGVDRSLRMLKEHPMRNEGHVLCADAYAIPFLNDSFDLTYEWSLLHHVQYPEQVVHEMARVTRKYLFLVEPNPWNPLQFLHALIDPHHRWVLRFRLRYMRSLCVKEGYRIVACGHGGWILPNRTPRFLLPILKRLPFRWPLGLGNWVLAEKQNEQ